MHFETSHDEEVQEDSTDRFGSARSGAARRDTHVPPPRFMGTEMN